MSLLWTLTGYPIPLATLASLGPDAQNVRPCAEEEILSTRPSTTTAFPVLGYTARPNLGSAPTDRRILRMFTSPYNCPKRPCTQCAVVVLVGHST